MSNPEGQDSAPIALTAHGADIWLSLPELNIIQEALDEAIISARGVGSSILYANVHERLELYVQAIHSLAAGDDDA